MKKYKVLIIMIPIIIALLAYSIIQQSYMMFGILGISSAGFLYVVISLIRKNEQPTVPLYDVIFGAGFILMMIELRIILTEDLTFFMMFLSSVMMAAPVYILLNNYFPVKTHDKEKADIDKSDCIESDNKEKGVTKH